MAKKKEDEKIRKELEKDGLDLDKLVKRKKKHLERLKRLDKQMQSDESPIEPPKEERES